MSELALHRALALGMIVCGVCVFFALFFVSAPYGRHARGGWGPSISGRLGWFIMESPSLFGFAALYAVGRHAFEPVPLLLAGLWLVHYFNRDVLHPLRMAHAPTPMPLSVAAMAFVFNVLNAYLNARWISHLGSYETSALFEPRFGLGVVAFLAGMSINVSSDRILFALRGPREKGYKVPHGGLYRLVSSPNYLGELIEWGGFALASGSLSGLAFFLFTFANLAPRAVSHHRWYRETFPDYPKERRALIPYLW